MTRTWHACSLHSCSRIDIIYFIHVVSGHAKDLFPEKVLSTHIHIIQVPVSPCNSENEASRSEASRSEASRSEASRSEC